MIESIEFKNFKCLRDTTLPLSPCTILVGPNGSGKTTALQALEAVSGRQRLGLEDIVTAALRNQNETKVEVRLKWAKPWAGIESIIRWERGKGQTTGFDDRQGERDANLIGSLIASIRVYWFEAKAIAAPATISDKVEMGTDGAGLAAVLDGLRDCEPERFDAINAQVGQWLPEFDRVLFERPSKGTKSLALRTKGTQHKIDARDLSQGTLLTLAMLTLAYLPAAPALVGLEEPDHGLHPYLLRQVQDAIYRLCYPESCGEQREPVQVIATTHSPYFLDLFKDHPDEIVVANKVGADVQFQRLTSVPHFGEMLGEATLGEAWYTGFLGGVPSEA